MLIAVSKKVKQQLEEGGVMGNRVRVVYDAIDLGQCDSSIDPQVVRETYGIQFGEPVIGTIAHLFPRKGYEFLISAMVEVRRAVPDVRWLVIGKGDPHYTAKLTDLIAKNGLEGLTKFLGYQTNIFPFLHLMDCVVLPSIMEGFGFVLVEAMAVGKPVIASRVGGIPEIVEDGVTGILVDPRDSRSLAKQIILLLQDPQRRLTMGRAGKRRVQEHFTRKRMNEQLCEVYGELLEGAKKA
jgi:glycosyltransferase involved in cell wall biosynthesis